MSKDYIINISGKHKIRATTFGNDNPGDKNWLIYVHGFKGFKDWGFVPYLGKYFADRGFFVITFNFSHNGIGEKLDEFSEMDKFAQNTFSKEVNELTQVIDASCSDFFGVTRKKKLGVIGHSRGGAVSLLASVKKREVDAVALWASISKLDRYTERQKNEWRKSGYFEVLNSRTNQMMRMNVSLLEDIETNKVGLLNIESAVRNLNRPLFIAHGDQDLSVPISEGEQLYDWSDKPCTEFFKLHSTGHTFDITHPFTGTSEKFEKLLSSTCDFFYGNFNMPDTE